MKFKSSRPFTLGIELELQIINQENNDLISSIDDVLGHVTTSEYKEFFQPEITQSMIEIKSGVHDHVQSLDVELHKIQNHLCTQTEDLNIFFTGGGTHPFQLWNERKLYPHPHYQLNEKKYGYLTKMFTVFGMHIHIGCTDAKEALYLTYALAKHIPEFIALSASSPFCQGIDTDFCSSRNNVVNLFPLSGMPPFTLEWDEFCHYVTTMQKLPWVEGIHNFYWDIRPRPDFGTIEIRICDTPLTIKKAVSIAAFAQTLAKYILEERPYQLQNDKYNLYRYNRFQASKYGFDAMLMDVDYFSEYPLKEKFIETCKKIYPHSISLNTGDLIKELEDSAIKNQTDSAWLRKMFKERESLAGIVHLAGLLWSNKIRIPDNF